MNIVGKHPFWDYRTERGQIIEKIKIEKLIILRHDVDLLPQNSLITAKLEHDLGIKGSYYFRIVPECYNENIIKQITELGHELVKKTGIHYI